MRGGRLVAIVGPSGSGKTTLARALLRLVDPSGGAVELDGVDYRELRLEDLRKLVYYVPSKDAILRGTLRENIALGESYSEEEIRRALEVADIDFAESPDQEISPESLSEGQKQRVAVARAVVRKPAVLILDEAPNAVEEWREEKILKNIRSYLRDSLVIVITHRSSTLKMADEVYVLEDGFLKRAAQREPRS